MFYPLRRLLERLSRIPGTIGPRAARRDRRATLSLEALEDRLTPTTDVWTGAAAAAGLANPDPSWKNPQNWVGDVAPQSGDSLVFPAAPKARDSNNNFASGMTFGSITFQGGGYQITGNAIQLQYGLTNSTGLNVVGLPITLSAGQTFTDNLGTALVLTGSLNNNGHLLTLVANGTLQLAGSSITGSGGLTVMGNSKCYLENTSANTYTGVTTVDSGTLYLAAPNGIAIPGKLVIGDGIGSNESAVVRLALDNQIASTSAVTIAWTGLLDLNGFHNTIGPLTMTGGNVTTGTGTLTLTNGVTTLAATTPAIIAGNLSLGTGTTPQTFTVGSGGAGNDLNVTATVSGGASVELIKAGTGTMQLTGNDTGNTYLGQTLVSAGTLVAANASALGAVSAGTTVNSGATLDLKDPNADSSYAFAAEPLTLNGGTLLANGQSPLLTFAGSITLAASGSIEVNAGTTLDLTGSITGTGGLTKMWAGTLELSQADSYTGATTVNLGSLVLDNAQAVADSATTVSGQAALVLEDGLVYAPSLLTLAGYSASNNSTLVSNGSATWTGSINLTGSATVWDRAGQVTLNGPISGPAANTLTVGNAASSATNGTVLLSSANTYAGATVVSAGTLAVANADALGSPGGSKTNYGTTVDTGATLELQGGVTFDSTESLTLNGFGVGGAGALLNGAGNNTWAGKINLATTSAIGAAADTTLTISGVISCPSTSNLLFVGDGTVVLTGTNTNFDGYARIMSGILAIDNAAALGGAPYNGGAGTTVESGATLEVEGGLTYAIEPLILNGTGVGGMGALVNLSGSNAWSGPIKLNSAATIASAAGSTLTDNVQLANEGYMLTVNAVGTVDLATTVSGAGGLTKDGTGTLIFSSAAPNLYTGPTIVNAGTLLLDKPAVIQAITGAGVTVNQGSTLAGSGLINTNVSNAGTVSPGGTGTIGTLTINGTYTQTTTGALDMELAKNANDLLMISGLATLDGSLAVGLLNGFQPANGNKFPIMTFGSSSGAFATVNLPAGMSIVYDPRDVTIKAQA